MTSIVGAVSDAWAATSGAIASSLQGELVVVDVHAYKPPEELRVQMMDVYESWKRDLLSGHSIFDRNSKNHQASSTNGTGNGGNHLKNGAGFAAATTPANGCLEPEIAKRTTDGELIWMGGPGADPDLKHINSEAKDILTFQHKVFKKAGLSRFGTYLPKSIHPKYAPVPSTDLDSAMEECKLAVCGAMQGLLDKMKLHPQDIDILVTTCSIFCPTPSMASMVVNHFKMKSSIQSYHLGGMGCGNGVVAINLMRDLLKARPNCNAILICNETTTPALYRGTDKHRLVTNVLFRMGASAILLSNKRQWRYNGQAKYILKSAQRVHLGASDDAYRAIYMGPDDEGINGIYLGLNVVKEATKALTIAMTKIAPHILTSRQLLEAACYYVLKYLGRGSTEPYMPCFAEGVQHFLIHAGGAKVLDGIGASLKLTESHLEPSRAVLYDYGNVSSSTTWYTLTFIEAVRGVRKGDKVLQIGVGSGIKCGVNVWTALRNIDDFHSAWEHRLTDDRRAALASRRVLSARLGSVLLLLALLVLLAAVIWNRLLQAGG